jgi:hypothetical protein
MAGDVASQGAAPSYLARGRWLWAISAVLLVGLAASFYLWTHPLHAPRVLSTTQITDDGKPKSQKWFSVVDPKTNGSASSLSNSIDSFDLC